MRVDRELYKRLEGEVRGQQTQKYGVFYLRNDLS